MTIEQRCIDLIRERPGMRFAELRDAMPDLANSVIHQALARASDRGTLVRDVSEGTRRSRYFLPGAAPAADGDAPAPIKVARPGEFKAMLNAAGGLFLFWPDNCFLELSEAETAAVRETLSGPRG